MSNLNKKPLGDTSTERRFRKECIAITHVTVILTLLNNKVNTKEKKTLWQKHTKIGSQMSK